MKKWALQLLSLFALYATAQAQIYNGYTLYASQNSTTAYLVDSNGVNTFHSWTGLGSGIGYSCHLEPGGTLVRAAKATGVSFSGGPICGKITKHDYNGNLTWNYDYSTTNYCTHHDVHPMPNGNVLVIAYERKTATEVTAVGGTQSIEMWPDKIVEIQPTGATTGTVVWEWKSWDHLMQNVDPNKPSYVTSLANNPQLLNINYKQAKDWQHVNGVDYNPILDQIAFSSHNHNEWYIIDHSTTTAEAAGHTGGNSGKGGDILYRWGNPPAYGASGTAILNVTHDAHWNGEDVPNPGRLGGYNNKGVSSNASAADEVDPPINGYNYDIVLGQAFAPSTYTYRFGSSATYGFYSSNMGSTQTLPNGNRLICSATQGKFFEVNTNNQVLYTKTVSGGSLPQAHKYSLCYIQNAAPAIPVITQSGASLTSTSAITYQWYRNGVQIAGATAQNYTPTQSGIYLVRITDANGCVFQYSKGFTFTYNPTALATVNFSDEINVYPNPTNGHITIANASAFGSYYTVSVIDIYGRVVKLFANATQLNISNLPNGMYTIQLIADGKVANKKIILNK
jgi:hypothetical protein